MSPRQLPFASASLACEINWCIVFFCRLLNRQPDDCNFARESEGIWFRCAHFLIIEPCVFGSGRINYGDQSASSLLRHSIGIRLSFDSVSALSIVNRELATLDSMRGDSNAGASPLCLIINANHLCVHCELMTP